MVFSRYLWTITGLALAMAATATGLGHFINRPGFGVSVSVFAIILAGETAFLLWYLTRTRRDLLRLLEALKNGDTTQVVLTLVTVHCARSYTGGKMKSNQRHGRILL